MTRPMNDASAQIPKTSAEELIYYLELKNNFYEKFLSVTEKFLTHIRQNQWEGLEFFVDNRERILNIIRSFDFKIAEASERAELDSRAIEAHRPRVKGLLDKRSALGKRILELDLEVMTRIEEVRSETIQELKRTADTQASVASFEAVENHSLRKPTKTA